MSDLPNIAADGFVFTPTQAGTKVEVLLSGNADMRVMNKLDETLETLLPKIVGRTREVVFDIRELYFMNSSCFKCFVTFIVNILDLPKAQQLSIVFRSNPKLHWQDRSLEALRSIASELVRIETA